MRKSVVVLLVLMLLGGIALAQTKLAPSAAAKEAASGAVDGVAVLPVKRVVLYKNGVGYFEHSGKVRGNQDLAIEFTTAQLNDVLKSLTAVDLGGGQITGVRYNSIAPLSERLKTLQIGLGEDVTSGGFLNALRGTRVEVRSGAATVTGKILSVETIKRETQKGATVDVTQLSIVGDGGELRSFEMGPGVSVRLVDGEIRQDVGRYLSLVGSTRSKDVRKMTISAAGSGERQLFVSYISEVPVWKSTYRIVVPKAPGTPFIQGWAIVDNTVGEDWKDVQLSLVSGAPQSFIQNISQPYYTRRPVVALPESAMLTPQEHEASMGMDAIAEMKVGSNDYATFKKVAPPPPPAAPEPGVGGGIGGGVSRGRGYSPSMGGRIADPSGAVVPSATVTFHNEITGATRTTQTDSNGHYRFFSLPVGPSTLTVTSPGFNPLRVRLSIAPGGRSDFSGTLALGSVTETVEIDADAEPDADISTNSGLMSAMRSQESGANGGKLGELFEYALKQKITVLKNQSALVPIVQSSIQAEKVTMITANEDGEIIGSPLRALWLRNTSGLMLDGGTFNILEQDAFAGEGVMDVLHPDERRLLSYAADTAVHAKAESDEESGMANRVRINRGVLTMTREERSVWNYEIHNADTTPRDVVIEHPIRENFKLVDGVKPEDSSTNYHRFKLKVEPKKTETLVVKEFRPDTTTVYLNSLANNDQVTFYASQAKLKPEVELALRKIVSKKNEIAAVDSDVSLRQTELSSIDKDQARVRENMKALKGSSEEKALLQRYTKQLDSQEDRINVLRNEISQLQTKRSQLQAELEQMIQNVDVDEKM